MTFVIGPLGYMFIRYVMLLFNVVSATMAIQRRPFSRILRPAVDTEDVFST